MVGWPPGPAAVLCRVCDKIPTAWDTSAAQQESGNPRARAVMLLCGWKAEMAMVLARMPMIFTNVLTKDFASPNFEDPESEVLHLYRRRSPEQAALSFLEWLRQHAVVGQNQSLIDTGSPSRVHPVLLCKCPKLVQQKGNPTCKMLHGVKQKHMHFNRVEH